MTTKSDAQERVRSATRRYVEAFAGVSPDNWVERPPTGGWSMSEATEHVTIANQGILSILRDRLHAPLGEPLGVTDEDMPYVFYREGDEPPGVAKPTGTWTDPDVAARALRASAQAVLDWADTTVADLRAEGCVHPAFGLMDGVQWLLFLAAHTERHRAQVVSMRRRLEGDARTVSTRT